jgi:DNA-binding MarR family transcriptional regulator
MKIEDAIHQSKPMFPMQKVFINLIYTYHWHMDRSNSVFKPFGITAQQYNVLRILKGRYPKTATMGEIKAVMLDKNPDLTRMCDRLLQKGWIERAFNVENRREVLVSITDAGILLLDKIEPTFNTWANHAPKLSEEEMLLLSDLLDKLRG